MLSGRRLAQDVVQLIKSIVDGRSRFIGAATVKSFLVGLAQFVTVGEVGDEFLQRAVAQTANAESDFLLAERIADVT